MLCCFQVFLLQAHHHLPRLISQYKSSRNSATCLCVTSSTEFVHRLCCSLYQAVVINSHADAFTEPLSSSSRGWSVVKIMDSYSSDQSSVCADTYMSRRVRALGADVCIFWSDGVKGMSGVRLSWLENAYSRPLFGRLFWPIKWVRVTWFLVCDRGSLVGLCMQDYKSLSAAVTICSTMVNIWAHIHTDSIFTSLYEKLS